MYIYIRINWLSLSLSAPHSTVFGSLYKATSVICGHQHTHTNTHTHTHIPFKVLRTNSTKRAAKSVCVKLIHVTAREREGGREGVRKGCEKKHP